MPRLTKIPRARPAPAAVRTLTAAGKLKLASDAKGVTPNTENPITAGNAAGQKIKVPATPKPARIDAAAVSPNKVLNFIFVTPKVKNQRHSINMRSISE